MTYNKTNKLDILMKIIGGVVVIAGSVALAAFFGGTVVWLIWPVAIPAAFPGLVASGVIAGKLTWWVSVCLVWLFGILIKATQTNKSEKK